MAGQADQGAGIVAIGGLGGSGTRVFSALLQSAGIPMGSCLNTALDNLWFTVLFKRAEWARTPRTPDAAGVEVSVRLLLRALQTGLSGTLSPEEAALLARLRADLPPEGDWVCGAHAAHVDSLQASTPPPVLPPLWGWKEPNTHLFLPHLDALIPGFRYIHIVRDGLDMAFSQNRWQAEHWGHLYGLPFRRDLPAPPQQLRFWAAANDRAIRYGLDRMPGRFLVIRYEDFCSHPQAHWQRIRSFLHLTGAADMPDGLVRPVSIGRSAAHDLAGFGAEVLEAARAVAALVAQHGSVTG